MAIWSDKAYAISLLPAALKNTQIIVRPAGAAKDWPDRRQYTATTDCTAFFVVRDVFNGQTEFPDDKARQLLSAGWVEVDELFRVNPGKNENWKWRIFKKDVPAGKVDLQVEDFKHNALVVFMFGKRAKVDVAAKEGNPLGVEITPEILSAKFAGKAKFDEKSGILEFTYPLRDAKELQDFEIAELKPSVGSKGVFLSGGQAMKHVVKFDSLSVAGVIDVKEMNGTVLTTTGGTITALGGAGKDGLYVVAKGQKVMDRIVAEKLRQGAIAFKVEITDKRATLYWGDEQLGGPSSAPGVGQVMLHGGNTGYAYSNLVITGRPNREWARKFFADVKK
jgi:hypothetical protein